MLIMTNQVLLSNQTAYKSYQYSVSCTQLINQPTRITQTSSTVIDHIYVNSMSVSHVIPTI